MQDLCGIMQLNTQLMFSLAQSHFVVGNKDCLQSLLYPNLILIRVQFAIPISLVLVSCLSIPNQIFKLPNTKFILLEMFNCSIRPKVNSTLKGNLYLPHTVITFCINVERYHCR